MAYALEDIREFFIRRSWLAADPVTRMVGLQTSIPHQVAYSGGVISRLEYAGLKDRTLRMKASHAAYLRAFIDGWLSAKGQS